MIYACENMISKFFMLLKATTQQTLAETERLYHYCQIISLTMFSLCRLIMLLKYIHSLP